MALTQTLRCCYFGRMPSLITVLIGALVTAVGGNYLVQRWQQRNWFAQQRQLVHQQELTEMKLLFDDLSQAGDQRLFAMRRLLGTVANPASDRVAATLENYRKEIAHWNTRLHSFFARMTLYHGWTFTKALEDRVHGGFRTAGQKLERLVRLRLSAKPIADSDVAEMSTMLDVQGGVLDEFYNGLMTDLQTRREEIVAGKRYRYDHKGLHHFSTGDLIKALFVSDVSGFYVIRPA